MLTIRCSFAARIIVAITALRLMRQKQEVVRKRVVIVVTAAVLKVLAIVALLLGLLADIVLALHDSCQDGHLQK